MNDTTYASLFNSIDLLYESVESDIICEQELGLVIEKVDITGKIKKMRDSLLDLITKVINDIKSKLSRTILTKRSNMIFEKIKKKENDNKKVDSSKLKKSYEEIFNKYDREYGPDNNQLLLFKFNNTSSLLDLKLKLINQDIDDEEKNTRKIMDHISDFKILTISADTAYNDARVIDSKYIPKMCNALDDFYKLLTATKSDKRLSDRITENKDSEYYKNCIKAYAAIADMIKYIIKIITTETNIALSLMKATLNAYVSENNVVQMKK
jgi:hypothetical protein